MKMESSPGSSRDSTKDVVRWVEPPMCALAKKVPKPVRNGSAVQQSKAAFAHNAMVNTINILMHCPDLKRDTESYVKQLYVDRLKKEQFGEGSVDVTTLDAYDPEFQASFVSKQTGFSLEVIGKAKALDAFVVKNMFRALTNMSGGLKLGDVCANRAVMQKATEARVAILGNRAPLFTDPTSILNNDGSQSWKGGIYMAIFPDNSDSEVATFVLHRPSGDRAAIDPDYNITKKWDLRMNWDDDKAEFFKAKHLRWKCADFFKKNEGPQQHKQLKGKSEEWELLTKKAFDDVQKEKSQGHAEASEMAKYHSPLKDAKISGIKRARESLTKRNEERESRRRTSLA